MDDKKFVIHPRKYKGETSVVSARLPIEAGEQCRGAGKSKYDADYSFHVLFPFQYRKAFPCCV